MDYEEKTISFITLEAKEEKMTFTSSKTSDIGFAASI